MLTSSLVEISAAVENSGRNVPFPKVLANHGLTQPIRIKQELGNVLGLFTRDEASLNKELYALLPNMSPQ
jgi:hypothetical protein